MKDSFRPGRTNKAVLLSLYEDPNQMSDLLRYLENRLKLIETVAPAKTHIQFVLDPLAEYLAGMYVVERCGAREDRWVEFFKIADQKPGAPQQTEEFLLAIYDCSRSGTVQYIPTFVLEQLALRAGLTRPSAAAAASGG